MKSKRKGHKKTSNTKSKTDISYNLNSALINSKLIEMNL